MATSASSPSPAAALDEKAEKNGPAEPNVETGEVLNASGHVQELDRNFSLLAVCSVGITTGNTWAALGGSIVIAIYNGGPPGVIYEFLAVSVFYWCIAALIAELASAMPSSAGVFHWATVTGGERWGRSIGFFAGWWNFLAWVYV
jgi:choline transport protein